MRQNPHVRICGGPGSATTLVYPTTLRWQPNRLDTATRQDLAEDTRVQGIAVVD